MKYILLILILLFPVSSSAGWWLIAEQAAVVEGETCDVATNEVGNRTLESTDQAISADYAYVFRSQADCSGALSAAYIYHDTSGPQCSVKIAVYTSNNADISLDTALDLVDNTSNITMDSVDWETGVTTSTGYVTQNDWYWIAIFAEESCAATDLKRGSTGTLYYRTTSGYYSSVPSSLSQSGWSSAALAPVSVYVTIGE